MESKVLVSIIVPIYNVEKYLDRCLSSLVGQTLKEIEIILVNDGSPDNCYDLCEGYKKKDSRIKVIHKENAGLGLARNSGISLAKGEYIAFVDSDDYVDLNMYKTLHEFSRKNNSDVVFCGFSRELIGGKHFHISECVEPVFHEGHEAVQKVMLDFIACKPHESSERKYAMSVWHSIYKREVIEQHQLRFVSEREYGSEDIPFQVDFMKKASKVTFIPDVFYFYLLNGSSLTKTFSQHKYERYKKLYFLLKEKNKEIDEKNHRASRFFIGYVRSHILDIIKSNHTKEEKLSFIEEICNDTIWKDISLQYGVDYLPFYQAKVYKMLLEKKSHKIYMFCQFVVFLKKVKFKIKPSK
ncbi:glycosyltransferase [Sphingobacterium sp. MYb382]|uniref:glycosyltransferase n=1 Tax=Sphingobacterium sp. MYb382 TaxID=2745278 RepID=UPI0030996D76